MDRNADDWVVVLVSARYAAIAAAYAEKTSVSM